MTAAAAAAVESIVNTYVTNGFKSSNCNKKSTCYKWAPNGIQIESKWDPNGIQMGSKWDPNGIQMGSKWDPNGIQMQQKVTYSRSYLVVTSICYKWLEKHQLQQKVNFLQMGSKWAPNGLQMGSKWAPNGLQMFQLQQKVIYSRSSLVVTLVTSICYW